MKRTVCVLIAVLMALSVFSICTVSALPDTDGQGHYLIQVSYGHAENEDGDTINYAAAGERVYVFFDGEEPDGMFMYGYKLNGSTKTDEYSFDMPAEAVSVSFLFAPQQVLNIDLTGDGKEVIPADFREEVTGALHYAVINDIIADTKTGFDLDKNGTSDIDYVFAAEIPFFKRLSTCNIIGDFQLTLPHSGRKFNFVFSFGAPTINKSSISLGAGKTYTLKISDGSAKSWTSSNKNVAAVSTKGVVTGLKKGTATITATTYSGKKLTCKVTVTSSPKLSRSSVTVKKGKSTTVKITGKASTVKNVYTNTKFAKITSKNTATTLKVKGLKKGSTTLKVKVNGVTLKLKVKVE